jgi:hypothetical protein
MNKMFFLFSFVFAFIQPLFSNALEGKHSYYHENIQQESFHFSQNSQSSNHFIADDQLDIEDDDINEAANNYFCYEKTARKTIYFFSPQLQGQSLLKIWSTSYFYQLPDSHFISLRVLQL